MRITLEAILLLACVAIVARYDERVLPDPAHKASIYCIQRDGETLFASLHN